jgi:hypothetical protein
MKFVWTTHSKFKMKQYRFSEKRVLRILRKPDRIEEGIAPKTIANMQVSGTKKYPTEAWMMYQVINSKLQISNSKQKKKIIKIISAWRYPGRTPKNKKPIIPKDTLEELNDLAKS